MESKVHLLDFLDYAEKTHPSQAGLVRQVRNRVSSLASIDPATVISIIMTLLGLFTNPAMLTQLNAILTALHLPPLPPLT